MKLHLRKAEIPEHLRKYFKPIGVKPQGDLCLAYRLAIALQEDGWIMRSPVIWAKAVSFNEKYSGSTMPESINGTRWERCRMKVKNKGRTQARMAGHFQDHSGNEVRSDAQWQDCPGCPKCEPNGGYVLRRGSWRPTRAHEYVFQFVKQIPYFADMEAVKEDTNPNNYRWGHGERKYESGGTGMSRRGGLQPVQRATRNIRDVWTINPERYADAHYATFPEALIEPMIKLSTSQKGCCPKCGAHWARVIDSKQIKRERPNDRTDRHKQGGMNSCGNTVAGTETTTIGWRPTCGCDAGDPVPCIVFDPFMGSGCTAAVAARLRRNYMGSELSQEYMKQIEARVQAAEMGIPKAEARKGQKGLFAGIWNFRQATE